MRTLTRWDPFQEIMSFQNEMNQLFDGTFRSVGNGSQNSGVWGLALDVQENEDAFIVQASLPGVNPDDIDVKLLNNVLTISGEIQEEQPQGRVHLRERSYGRFYRSVRLPVAVDSNSVDAAYESGVLTLTLPKAEEAKPKRIAVSSNGQRTIEGQTA